MQQIFTKKLAWNLISQRLLVLFILSFFSYGLATAQTPADENYDNNSSFDITSNDFSLDGIRYRISGNGTTYRTATYDGTYNLSEGNLVIMLSNSIKMELGASLVLLLVPAMAVHFS